MRKITTLYKKNPENLSLVIPVVDPENNWVFTDSAVKKTRKYDGTAAAIIGGVLYKRYDVKEGRKVPEGAIPCQEPDPVTGHWPHWVACNINNKEDKYFFKAFSRNLPDGTYELCGPKVQGNPEGFESHVLVRHGETIVEITDLSFYGLKEFFLFSNIEGIVFHHPDGRMCKIRKSDFGIKR